MTITTPKLTFEEYLKYDHGTDRIQSQIFPKLELTVEQVLSAED